MSRTTLPRSRRSVALRVTRSLMCFCVDIEQVGVFRAVEKRQWCFSPKGMKAVRVYQSSGGFHRCCGQFDSSSQVTLLYQ